MRYEIPYFRFAGRYSRTYKGTVIGDLESTVDWKKVEWVVIDAVNALEAYEVLNQHFRTAADQRLIRGNNFIHRWEVPRTHMLQVNPMEGFAPLDRLPRYGTNDRVVLHMPYQTCRAGKVVSYNDAYRYGVLLDGLGEIVDFTIRQIASESHAPSVKIDVPSLPPREITLQEKLATFLRSRKATRTKGDDQARQFAEYVALYELADWVEEQAEIALGLKR